MVRFLPHALRDVLILCLTAGLWWWVPHGEGWSVLTGVMTGLCALLFHEWGHLHGAQRVRALVHRAPLWSPFLFDLDSRQNDREQFLGVSLWGFAATGVYLLTFSIVLPINTLAGQVAMGIALFLATLTVVIEFPLAWRVYRGGKLPPVEIHRRGRH